MIELKKFMFELILGECKQDPDPVFQILICRIRIRPQMVQILNPVCFAEFLDIISENFGYIFAKLMRQYAAE